MSKVYIILKYVISIILTVMAICKMYQAETSRKDKNFNKASYEISWTAVALLMLMLMKDL